MGKKVNRKGQQGDLPSRERIIAAAVHLFARQGYGGTGLRELAAAAGVNLAMINYFFGSKKALLKEILDGFLEGYLAVARQELAGDEPLTLRLERFIRRAVDYFDANPDALLVTITELPRDDPEIIEYKAAWGRQMMAIIDREVCMPLADQGGRRLPPRLVGPMLTSMMASRFLFAPLMEHLGPDEQTLSTGEYGHLVSTLFLHGIAGTGSRPEEE
ncbi:TetR/AcrR family transcriptional regulator [Thermodesulfobacteriota bacterium B35]